MSGRTKLSVSGERLEGITRGPLPRADMIDVVEQFERVPAVEVVRQGEMEHLAVARIGAVAIVVGDAPDLGVGDPQEFDGRPVHIKL